LSGTYATSLEIQDYFKDFVANHNLNRFIKLSHEVVSATWNGGLGIWNVAIKNNLTGTVLRDSAQVLINCGGVLNAWKWPNIPGIDKFRGPLVHSANWDESVSLEGKVVGLIGNG
jgi:cation diffusion facilitator CzcD-associated flavoprotein CzcO